MAFIAFIAGMFLGAFLGFAVMALLALSSRDSELERRQQMGVISPGAAPSDASIALRWRKGHRRSELDLPLGTRTLS